IKWEELKPQSPFYFFVPKDLSAQDEYNEYWQVTDIFPINSVGFATARDHFSIHFTPEEVWDTIVDFSKLGIEEARNKYRLRKDVRDWKVDLAQKDVIKSGIDKNKIISFRYRPFDFRFTYYTGKTKGFMCMPRRDTLEHMLSNENKALITSRMTKEEEFKHVHMTKKPIEVILLSSKSSNNAYIFPLYIYPELVKKKKLQNIVETNLKWKISDKNRIPNINFKLIEELEEKLNLNFITEGSGDFMLTFSAEDVLNYIYAILHSDIYRKKYTVLLGIDYPRIPFTKNVKLFKQLSEIGKKLSDLHLMESKFESKVKFDNIGSNIVEKIEYENDKIHINNDQFFEGITEDIWNFCVGGYNVLESWLKYRKKRQLSSNEIEHFIQVIEIIKQSIKHMTKIDELITVSNFIT
ncbi:MAG: type ISP restriction/modification enzyme, partial [Candidatus Helarchaeota archaeon]